MSISGSGGGFFFSPFHYCYAYGAFLTSGVGVDAWGAWTEYIASMPANGRWLQIKALWPTASAGYSFELGLGAVGFETPWLPINGLGTRFEYRCPAAGSFDVNLPYIQDWNFPIFVRTGGRITVRLKDTAAGANQLQVYLYIFG